MPLLQTQLDGFFKSIEEAIVCDKNTLNFINNLKPLPYEIDTMPWRFRVMGFIEAMLVTKKMSVTNFESFFSILFENHVNDVKQRSGDNKLFAVKVYYDNSSEAFDIKAVNYIDAYFKLTKRTGYRQLINIHRVEVYKGSASNISDKFNDPVQVFDSDKLVYMNLADLSLVQGSVVL